MKKAFAILACALASALLLSGCAKYEKADESAQNTSEEMIMSVEMPEQDEVPVVGFVHDGELGDIVYDFKNPEDSEGIVVTLRE